MPKQKDEKLFATKQYETPPRCAQATGRSADTFLAYIASGELEAVNFGSKSRPRWGISEAALNAFLASRSNKPQSKVKSRKKTKSRIPELV